MVERQLELVSDGTWEPIRVLFVCLGNICRSPLAEAVFRHRVEERGWTDRFEIDSAGTSGWHRGAPPDARSAEVARRRGIEVAGASRRVVAADLRRFHYVIAMDEENLDALRELQASAGGTAQVRRLREFEPRAASLDVPDPYYGGPHGFDRVLDQVEAACRGLLDEVRSAGAA